MQKYFRSIFGSNENFKICFRDLLTFSKYCLLGEGATFQIRILVEFRRHLKNSEKSEHYFDQTFTNCSS